MNKHYMAGLIDGEGTITLLPARGEAFRVPAISVQMCEESLIAGLHGAYGGKVRKRRAVCAKHNDAFTWELSGPRAVALIGEIYPHLRVSHKRLRAALIVHHIGPLTKRNGKYSKEETSKRRSLEKLFFDLTPLRNSPILDGMPFETATE